MTRCRHSGKRRAYLCCFDGRLASAKTIPNESALSTAWRMSIECNRRSSEIRLLAPAFTEQRLAGEATLQTQRGKIIYGLRLRRALTWFEMKAKTKSAADIGTSLIG